MNLNLPILMVELGWKWLGIDSFCNYNSIVLCQFCDKQGRKKYCWWMLFLGHRTLTSRCFLKQLGSEDMLACVIFYNFFSLLSLSDWNLERLTVYSVLFRNQVQYFSDMDNECSIFERDDFLSVQIHHHLEVH